MDTPDRGWVSPQPLQASVADGVPTQTLERGEKMNVDPERCSMERSSVEPGTNGGTSMSSTGT